MNGPIASSPPVASSIPVEGKFVCSHCRTQVASTCPIRIDENFACLASLQPLHSSGKVLHGNTVGNHGMEFQFARFEQTGHLIPGLIHPATVDSLDRDALEDDVFGEVE